MDARFGAISGGIMEARAIVMHDGGYVRRAMRIVLLPAALLLGSLSIATLGGCGDETSEYGEGERRNVAEAAPHKTDWLELSSSLTPAQWLVSRGADAPAPLSDPQVQRVTQQLSAAHKRYRESERMIANRSVQLSDMLKQIGVTERASQILDDLTSIGAEVGQTEGFGAISQYYFNLRAASATRADALSTLKARYGSKS
jgi:hypothetical protein